MRSFRRLLLAAEAAAAMAPPAAAVAAPAPAQAASLCGLIMATAASRHVLIVILENRRNGQMIGNSAAPFQNSLASSYRSWKAYEEAVPSACDRLSYLAQAGDTQTVSLADDFGLVK